MSVTRVGWGYWFGNVHAPDAGPKASQNSCWNSAICCAGSPTQGPSHVPSTVGSSMLLGALVSLPFRIGLLPEKQLRIG